MGIVVFGVCGVKPAGEGVLGTLAGVSSNNRSGIRDRVHSSMYPYCYGFQSLGVGDLLALGGYELAPV
jgi:hypothetical protein